MEKELLDTRGEIQEMGERIEAAWDKTKESVRAKRSA
jgi:hypothetical protein